VRARVLGDCARISLLAAHRASREGSLRDLANVRAPARKGGGQQEQEQQQQDGERRKAQEVGCACGEEGCQGLS
jgi:hypothetical protein